MKMKLATLVFLAVVYNHQLFSQCNLIKNKDEFTKVEFIMTENVTIANVIPLKKDADSWALDIRLFKKDSLIGLMLIHESGYSFDYINEVYFILENDITITKKNRIGQSLQHPGKRYICYSTFQLTKEELMSLSNNNILKYRVVFSNFPEYPTYDKELKDKKSLSIKEMSSCLLAEVK